MIAALYVQRNGVYYGPPDVDPWDEERDARLYAGPWPVVAHPPCARWCRMAGFVESFRPDLKKGEDGGLFERALEQVRTYCGVLEHPAHSLAFYRFGLPIPQAGGGWQYGLCGGASCYVEQVRYGHRATKGTWLYAYGCHLPALNWGFGMKGSALLVRARARRNGVMVAPVIRNGAREFANSSRTPIPFRDLLLDIARTAIREEVAA